MIGQTISHFNILSKLGEGGMGVVYKAEDTKLGRTVAIKFLPQEIAAQEEAKKRFKIEAKAAAALNHPNIATIHQIEETEKHMFIVMEYVEGRTLRQLLQVHGPFPLENVLNYAIQIAGGLQAAHKKGIIHRDIKSANIMLTENNHIKVMDFGLAKLAGQTQITKEGTTVGTIAYISPEQAHDTTAIDHRSDIWSFGVVLYEMLAGQVPFQSDHEMAVMYAIMNQDTRPIPGLPEEVADKLQVLVDKALMKSPDARYQQMDEVLDALHALTGSKTAIPEVLPAKHHTVGREKELTELQTALQNTFAGKSLLLCVAGEPGIGKTTLVEQFLDEVTVSSSPCLIASGQCSERLAGTEAYLPFLEALQNLLQQETGVPVVQLMREKAPWWYAQVASLSPDDPANAAILADVQTATQERVKRELAAFLQEVSTKQPLLLFFEDLHWADVSSIDMIAYLSSKFGALRLLFVATYRPEDMLLSEHPFLQIKPDLLSKGRCRELTLSFLPQEEIEHYLALEFPGHAFPEAFAQLIHDKTEGSPLFMVDLIQDLQNREVIAEENGHWQLTHSVEKINLELPDSIKGMIERKIQQLSEDDHRLMIAASIQGFEFDSAVVATVLEMDEEEVEEQLQKLEKDHHFVQFMEEDEFPDYTLTLRYRFIHALYQNELYNSLMHTKRARLSRAAAEALEGFYGEKSNKVSSELAILFEAARNFNKAVAYYSIAATQAAQVFAYHEAIAFTRRGLILIEKQPESKEREQQELSLQAHLAGSLVAIRGYGFEEVGKAYTRAHLLSKKLGLNKQNATAFIGLLGYFNVTAQLRKSLEFGQELFQLTQRESGEIQLHYIVSGGLGIAEQFLGNYSQASTYFEKVLQFWETQEQPRWSSSMIPYDPMVYTLGHNAWNLWILGYNDQAIRQSIEAKANAEETRNPAIIAHYFGFAGFLHQSRGDLEKLSEMCEGKISISKENALHFDVAWGIMLAGWAKAQQGEQENGLSLMLEGITVWRAVGAVCFVPYWHALIAEIYGQLNQPDKGLTLLTETLEIVSTTEHHFWEPEIHRIKGELLLLKDETEAEAEACYQKALKVARKQEAKSLELRAVISLGRLCQQQGRDKEAQELLSEIYNWFTEGFDTRDLQEAKALLGKLN